jgi:hypothetical protein
MGISRFLIALFGALPASVLGSFAGGVTFGGLRSLASVEASGSLFMVWGLLGLIGLAGLWLAVLVGPGSSVASALIACGLAADAVLFFPVLTNAASGTPVTPSSLHAAYVLLLTLPFLVGVAYICHAVLRARRAGSRQHGAV